MHTDSLLALVESIKKAKVGSIAVKENFPACFLYAEVDSPLPLAVFSQGMSFTAFKMKSEGTYLVVKFMESTSQLKHYVDIWKAFPKEVGTVESLLFFADAYVSVVDLEPSEAVVFNSASRVPLHEAFAAGDPNVSEAILWAYTDKTGAIQYGHTLYTVVGDTCEMKDSLSTDTSKGLFSGLVMDTLASVFSPTRSVH